MEKCEFLEKVFFMKFEIPVNAVTVNSAQINLWMILLIDSWKSKKLEKKKYIQNNYINASILHSNNIIRNISIDKKINIESVQYCQTNPVFYNHTIHQYSYPIAFGFSDKQMHILIYFIVFP